MKLCGFGTTITNISIYSILYYILLLINGKIIFSVLMLLSVVFILIIVNNAKYKNLNEPLVFSDYDYFTDAFRFPRLYIPFLGVVGIIGIVLGLSLIICGYFLDTSYIDRLALKNGLGISILCIAVSSLFLLINLRLSELVTFKPKDDLDKFGLAVNLWVYFVRYLNKPQIDSKFSNKSLKKGKGNILPNLIAIQSESFFDPRDWNKNIKEDVLKNFDAICKNSRLSGLLSVPAFGANTIRSEFSFLTGVSPHDMDAHQFSPYQIMSRKSFQLKSFVNFLKDLGYYTVCIHPYYKKFYHRDVIFEKWGFDEFLDIKCFEKIEYSSAYVSDEAVTKKILSLVNSKCKSNRPLFIFAITMENHGPMQLERISESESNRFYKLTYDSKLIDHDLSVYLSHLQNADMMINDLTLAFKDSDLPTSIVFYGDHIPIMPNAYKNLGAPSGKVPFFIWDNQAFIENILKTDYISVSNHSKVDLNIEQLPYNWLFFE